MSAALRNTLVETCLAWQKSFGVSPHVTSAISELDAARLVGLSSRQYSLACKGRTAVSAGYDFKYGKNRYQMKANRPSGAKGSKVTRVGKPKNLNWDILIWILYNDGDNSGSLATEQEFVLQEVP